MLRKRNDAHLIKNLYITVKPTATKFATDNQRKSFFTRSSITVESHDMNTFMRKAQSWLNVTA